MRGRQVGRERKRYRHLGERYEDPVQYACCQGTGQESGQGETDLRERENPLPGAPGEALVPYYEVYYEYLDAATRAMEQAYVPTGLREYVREYFSQLEP